MRGISQVVAMLIIIAIVIGAGIFLALVVFNALPMFKQSTSVTVTGGRAFIDPSDQSTVFGEVVLSIVGPDTVYITGVSVDYGGTTYTAQCLNCNLVINSHYPNTANDIVTVRFYFKTSSAVSPRPGDKIIVSVAYSVKGETRQAIGTITVFSS